jgi:tRNA pseudouridine32 synthase/23S rRNA pseudouridine746 synthase
MSAETRFEKHLPVLQAGLTAVDLLAQSTSLSKQRIKTVMQRGAVWLTIGNKTQRVRRAKRELKSGQTLHLYYDESVIDQMPLEPILIKDMGAYSVWQKPCGLLSQGSKWGDHCTVTRWAEQHLLPQRPAFVVHRLDRAANGVIMIAHEKGAAAKLSALFQQRDIEKRYQISVMGEFSTDTVTVDEPIDGKSAVSHFTRIHYAPTTDQSLIDVSIETGRKHQIRRHAAYLGFPVVGDRLYGPSKQKVDLQLKAYFLSFHCPYSGQVQTFNIL